MIVVEIVEIISDSGKKVSLEGSFTVEFQFQDVELDVE